MSNQTIFPVTNHHAAEPPAWVSSSTDGRRGYFENEHGERRLLAALDDALGRPLLGFEGVILNAAEKHWLRAMLLLGESLYS